jgi:hypothetical protein
LLSTIKNDVDNLKKDLVIETLKNDVNNLKNNIESLKNTTSSTPSIDIKPFSKLSSSDKTLSSSDKTLSSSDKGIVKDKHFNVETFGNKSYNKYGLNLDIKTLCSDICYNFKYEFINCSCLFDELCDILKTNLGGSLTDLGTICLENGKYIIADECDVICQAYIVVTNYHIEICDSGFGFFPKKYAIYDLDCREVSSIVLDCSNIQFCKIGEITTLINNKFLNIPCNVNCSNQHLMIPFECINNCVKDFCFNLKFERIC